MPSKAPVLAVLNTLRVLPQAERGGNVASLQAIVVCM